MGIKALIISGDGINCEQELKGAFVLAGADADILHINEVLCEPRLLETFQILGLPGGFSFGDELRSGKILAEKIRYQLLAELKKFLAQKKLILGVCNGFQVLVQLGAFENFNEARQMTLTTNDHGEFRNFWTKLTIEKTNSPWLTGLEGELCLPVRHKEGRLLLKNSMKDPIKDLSWIHQALTYTAAINGSWNNTAGLVDESGLILGLMPHPEAALYPWLHPYEEGADENALKVRRIFSNAVRYFG